MKKNLLVVALTLFTYTLWSQNTVKLTERQLMDSLELSLFSETAITKKDTLHAVTYGEETFYVIGNKDRVNKAKATEYLRIIRNEKLTKQLSKLKQLYKRFEEEFKKEWQIAERAYDQRFRDELAFFMEFEKTLFSLTVDSMYRTPKKKYDYVKESYWNIYDNRYSNLVFSDYYKYFSGRSVEREKSYLQEHADELGDVIVEEIKNFKLPTDRNSRKESSNMFYYYVATLTNVCRHIDGSKVDNTLIERYPYYKHISGLSWYVPAMAGRGTKQSAEFLIDRMIHSKNDTERKFCSIALFDLKNNADALQYASDYLLGLAEKYDKDGNSQLYTRVLKKLQYIPTKESVDYFYLLKERTSPNYDEFIDMALYRIYTTSNDFDLKRYVMNVQQKP